MNPAFLRLGGAFLGNALLVAAVAFCLWLVRHDGYTTGYRLAESQGQQALEHLRRSHAEQESEQSRAAEASAKTAAQHLRAEQARADQLAVRLAEQQRQHRQTTDRLTGEIARVNDLYRSALDAPPQPLPACVFTRGWVRLYDQATGAELPAADDSGRVAAPTADARALEQLDTGLGQRDVLAHHIHYAEQCRNTAAQLDALIDAIERQ